jgi:hypothetical protein
VIPIPGVLIALATFPGVIVHESAHLLFCKLRRVAVFDVCFFRVPPLDKWFSTVPIGYVLHERPADFTSSFLISVGPFFINTLLCLFFCFPALFPIRMHNHFDPLSCFFLWLGISIGMHAFPSTGDARVLWQEAKSAAARWNPLAILSLPLVVLIVLANLGSFFWLDALYGIAIGLILPELVLKSLS